MGRNLIDLGIHRHKILFILLLAVGIISCQTEGLNDGSQSEKLFTHLLPEETGIDFNNQIENKGNYNIFKYRNFYDGGGVAIGDINNDGLEDIYLTANMLPNKLYLNKGNFKFEDITESAGVAGNKPWSTGVTMADINHDGFLDIYVSNAGNMEGNSHDNDLYINNGDLTFTERASEYNLAETGFTIHSSFFDYDKDGDLDVYILNNSNIPVTSLGYAQDREKRAEDWDVPHIFSGVGDMLLRNDNGKFTNVSTEAGIYGSLIGFGLGVLVSDINQDQFPDIYICNDFYERDYLYINNQDGTFTEDIENWTQHITLSSMGIDMGDINNDGLNDIFITDMIPESTKRTNSIMEFEGYDLYKLKEDRDFYKQFIQNTLQLNNGNNSFSEIAYYSGTARTGWSWAGIIFDMDNDGYKDIFVTNGILHDLTDIDFIDFFANEVIQDMALSGNKEEVSSIIEKMPVVPLENYAYRNNHDLTFQNMSSEWGFDIPSFSNGSAYSDLDNDGDLDIVINNLNMQSFIYKNNSERLSENNYLRIKFNGSDYNRFAVGASVKLYINEKVIFQELVPSRGFQSSMGYTMVIGLGNADRIDSLRIIWPDTKTQKLTDVEVNQTITLEHQEALEVFVPSPNKTQNTYLKEIANNSLVRHEENHFNDFDHEGLIGRKLSQEGPAMAIADINGDGNDDVYIGGAKDQAGMLYFHLGNGNLSPVAQNSFESDARLEDTAAAFLDVDGDGDQDLMVGTGGNEVRDQRNYNLRLYINDSKGNFTKAVSELPILNNNVSVIAPYDFDSDGDIDLFVGSRSVPGIYGVDPEHQFLVNNGDGTFSDGTERYAYQLKDAGMITDAKWADMDGDNTKDLIITTDWGTTKIYNNSRGLGLIKSSLDSLHGWWNSLEVADLDKDGDNDLVLGNKGKNMPYKAGFNKPMKLWINDFDENGAIEQITSVYELDGDYPIHMRKEITSQIVSLKKENLMASEYAKKTVQELFPEPIMNNTIVKQVNISESIIAINKGNGVFNIKILPKEVQFSCMCGITCTDVNNDGHIDIIMAGNDFEWKPQFSQLDANYGSVLLGDGNMEFKWQDYNKSGFSIRSEVKHLSKFKDSSGNEYLIAAINNSKPRIFKLRP